MGIESCPITGKNKITQSMLRESMELLSTQNQMATIQHELGQY